MFKPFFSKLFDRRIQEDSPFTYIIKSNGVEGVYCDCCGNPSVNDACWGDFYNDGVVCDGYTLIGHKNTADSSVISHDGSAFLSIARVLKEQVKDRRFDWVPTKVIVEQHNGKEFRTVDVSIPDGLSLSGNVEGVRTALEKSNKKLSNISDLF